MSDTITIRPASREEVPLVLEFIRELARYERLEHEMSASEPELREALFGERRYAEVVFACSDGTPVG
ncbi:MAG: GNAT family N-acetyltransferase, partial [Steroidobacteraceae bacterium]